jgi:hypothetical protein
MENELMDVLIGVRFGEITVRNAVSDKRLVYLTPKSIIKETTRGKKQTSSPFLKTRLRRVE